VKSHIGIFTYSTKPRGSVVHAASLAEALTRAGQQVTLFALQRGTDGFFRSLACDVCLLPAAEAPADVDALIRQRIAEFVSGLERVNPALDVLHAQDCLAASALLEARTRPGLALAHRPLVRTVHHVEHFESIYLLECQRRSILQADLVLSVSEATRQALVNELATESQRAWNGVDAARFAPAPAAARAALRASLDIGADELVVLSVGGVEERKNSLRCLGAFAALTEQLPRARWVVVGGASILDHRAYQERFDQQLAALAPGTRERVRRLGSLSDAELRAWYAAADVLLCPSEQEGWGLCVLEAMAAELPVVVSRQPPFTEYVSEREGLLVDPTNESAICAALAQLAADPAWRARLGAAGRRVAARFSWTRAAELHIELYERARRSGSRAAD
jgi:glycosyltransferase-like protein